MISAINPVGYNRTVQFKGTEQQPAQKSQSEKKGMSTTSKTLLGLGALAAVTVGGIMAKKHIDTKVIKSLIDRPQEFNETYFNNFLKKWFKEFNLKPGEKGDLTLMSKNKMGGFINVLKKEGKLWPQLEKAYEQMSDNGIFAILKVSDSGKVYLKYLDPEKINIKVNTKQSGLKDLKDIFAEDEVFVRNWTN